MRQCTNREWKRIVELIDQGYIDNQIVDKMVKANYDRKWAMRQVSNVFENIVTT